MMPGGSGTPRVAHRNAGPRGMSKRSGPWSRSSLAALAVAGALALGPALVVGGCGSSEEGEAHAERASRTTEAAPYRGAPAGMVEASDLTPPTPAEIELYPRPVPVSVVERVEPLRRPEGATGPGRASPEPAAYSQAVRIHVDGSHLDVNLLGEAAPAGRRFLVLDTRWENIHPPETIERSRAEGRRDRTMGVGGFAAREETAEREYVEVDVAYRVPNPGDHTWLVADGRAYTLHPLSARLEDGLGPRQRFQLDRHGEVKPARLAFLLPEDARDVALLHLDYAYGHALAPVRGDPGAARGDGGPPAGALDRAVARELELVSEGLDWADEYEGKPPPDGYRWAVVRFSGRSLSAQQGEVADIMQFRPRENLWVSFDGGHLRYASSASADAGGFLRFPPEVFRAQEAVFAVPEDAGPLALGVRVENEAALLRLSERLPMEPPEPRASHRDADVLEVRLVGVERRSGEVLLDLVVEAVAAARGVEVQAMQQFLLVAGGREVRPDRRGTAALSRGPPDPFIVPPGTPVRFQLVYRTAAGPEALRYRGFREDGRLPL